MSNIAALTALMQGSTLTASARVRWATCGSARRSRASAAAVAGTFIDVIPAQWVFAAAALIGLSGAIAFFWIRYEGAVRTTCAPASVGDRA